MILLFFLGCSQPLQPLLLTAEEPKGSNCPNGGTAVSHGLDLNQNGNLDPNEVVETKYVCLNQQLSTTVDEPKGSNCPNGGTAISYGLDLNGNGTLDANEINQTKYACQKKSKALSKAKVEELIKQMPIFADGKAYCRITTPLDGTSKAIVFGRPYDRDHSNWRRYLCFKSLVDEGYGSYGRCVDHDFPNVYECWGVEFIPNASKGALYDPDLDEIYIPCGTNRFSKLDNIVQKSENQAEVFFRSQVSINQSVMNIIDDCDLVKHKREGNHKESVEFFRDQEGKWIISDPLYPRNFPK